MKSKTLFLLFCLFLTGCNNQLSSSEFDYADYDYVNTNDFTKPLTTSAYIGDFSSLNSDSKALIIALLENYTIKNHLSGIPLYDDSSLIKISDRINIPTKTLSNNKKEYIYNYGFGLISEGSIKYDLPSSKFPSYFHMFESKDPNSFSFYNNSGSIASKYMEYVNSAYFDKKLLDSKDGYEYYASLASNLNIIGDEYLPLPIDINNNVVNEIIESNKYRIYLKDNLVYNTFSNNSAIKTYKNKLIELKDYLTPYKYLYNKKNNLSAIDNNFLESIINLKQYYNDNLQTSFNDVGIKVSTDSLNNKYIEFTLNEPIDPYQARELFSNRLYSPIPESFINSIKGINNYGGFINDLTPIDTMLSTGSYILSSYSKNEYFTFVKNDLIDVNVLGGSHRYKIEGIYVKMLKDASYNPNAGYLAYNNKFIDYLVVPNNKYEEELDKKDTYLASSSAVSNLSINQCDKDTWQRLFGENGTVCKTNKKDYFNVELALSNQNFLRGLHYCINRKQLALTRGKNPTIDYVPDTCLLTNNGKSYNDSTEHQESLLMYYDFNETLKNEYGYDFDLASKYFKLASKELINKKAYNVNDTIVLDIVWPSESNVKTIGKSIQEDILKAFNHENNLLKIEINHIVCEGNEDMIENKIYKGQYDLAFGTHYFKSDCIEQYLEGFKSDNTLSHGINTNEVSLDNMIEFEGVSYTYDALLSLLNGPTLICNDGSKAISCDVILQSNKINIEDRSRNIVLKYDVANIKDENGKYILNTSIEGVKLCDLTKEYEINNLVIDQNTKTISFNISNEVIKVYNGTLKIKITFEEVIDEKYHNYIYKEIPINIPVIN